MNWVLKLILQEFMKIVRYSVLHIVMIYAILKVGPNMQKETLVITPEQFPAVVLAVYMLIMIVSMFNTAFSEEPA